LGAQGVGFRDDVAPVSKHLKDEWCVTFRLFTPDGTALPHAECPMAIALKENREVRGVEAMAQRPDGTMFPFLPYPTPIRDEDGSLLGAVNMLVDISERKQAETNQRILLDELNHRVKNNMQMLHGLLRAAQRESKSAEAQAVLADASQRVGAMAAAQKHLYSDRNVRGFSIGEFLLRFARVLPKPSARTSRYALMQMRAPCPTTLQCCWRLSSTSS
jgi:PAS domain-containing protein